MKFPTATSADIGLLLEGTFPFVAGGVSSWVNQIIRAFPEYRFACVFIGSQVQDYGEMKYALPENVVHLETHYLRAARSLPVVRPGEGHAETFARIEKLHDYFRAPGHDRLDDTLAEEVFAELHKGGKLSEETFLYSRRSWDYITKQYRRYSTDPSFVDYFWTVRMIHEPLWMFARIADNLLPVRAIHTVSTGYAGFLGALLKRRRGCPLILSEHGIYTKERKIDLFQSEWIKDSRSLFHKNAAEISYIRRLWIRFFESLGRLCYDSSDIITALYEANRQRQIADGADPARTRNIPNGINLQRLAPLRAQRPARPPPVLCLIGRVVPIKDVKTFIRAMRIVVNRLPEAQGWIAGPTDEDPAYGGECVSLAASLGLAERVKFLGFQKIDDILPRIGVMILSSISEALPLVILEGYAAGVPAVATDVGSCRQLVYGFGEEDAALGPSGRVVRIADPQALAKASLELLTDAGAWHAAQQAGIRRVEKFYTQELMFERFGAVYRQALSEESKFSKSNS
jgi:glycosyltransferase involved in cell wall biosynthesis